MVVCRCGKQAGAAHTMAVYSSPRLRCLAEHLIQGSNTAGNGKVVVPSPPEARIRRRIRLILQRFCAVGISNVEVCIIRSWKGLLILDLGALAGLDERLWWKEAPATLSVEKSPTEEKGRCTMASPHMELRRQGLASDLALPVTLLEPAFSQAIGAGSLTEVHIGLS